jgi:pimeloyl-ACP methyl ester carboxylesterase
MSTQNKITGHTKPTNTGLVQVSTSPDVQIFYSVDGPLDGSKAILLFLNSLAASQHLWDEPVTLLEAEYCILRYDARFHGQSPPSANTNFDYAAGHSIEGLADDILKILDHLEIQKVRALIGSSIGAAVGLIFSSKSILTVLIA